MKRILVTGARGFIGRHVCAALRSSEVELHAVSSTPVNPGNGIIWHRADLLDPVDRRALVESVGASALVHLAWCARPPSYWKDPDNLRWVGATLDLARTFAECGGTRMVAAGTCAEYDWRHGYCVEHQTPSSASTLYSASKVACGQIVDAYGRETGLSVAWARLFFLFGPHDAPSRLIPALVSTLRAGRPFRCAAGNHVRDFLFVVDAAAAIAALVDSLVTGPVNVASGIPVRIGNLATQIADRLNRRDLLSVEEGSREGAFVVASVARLHEEVGWRPSYDFAAALDETIGWWSSASALEVIA